MQLYIYNKKNKIKKEVLMILSSLIGTNGWNYT